MQFLKFYFLSQNAFWNSGRAGLRMQPGRCTAWLAGSELRWKDDDWGNQGDLLKQSFSYSAARSVYATRPRHHLRTGGGTFTVQGSQ